MALLYRMGTGNGSGGDLKPYIVQFTCDSGYIGQTLTMTYKGTPHAGETVNNVSGTVASDGTLTLYPMHSGNWECSCYSSVTGTTMKKTIELSYWGTTNVSFEDIPNGATVTPTDDVQTWLHCANIWDKSYTAVADVIKDTTTLNALIANENANDYLVRSTSFATDLCSNETAMTYIDLNDYCANKLLANTTWSTSICDSIYFKSILNRKIATHTSNTSSSGTISGHTEFNPAYYSVNNDNSNYWQSSTSDSVDSNYKSYLDYAFSKANMIKKIQIQLLNDSSGSTYDTTVDIFINEQSTAIKSLTVPSAQVKTTLFTVDIPENTQYVNKIRIAYRGYNKNYNGNTSCTMFILQCYGREQ